MAMTSSALVTTVAACSTPIVIKHGFQGGNSQEKGYQLNDLITEIPSPYDAVGKRLIPISQLDINPKSDTYLIFNGHQNTSDKLVLFNLWASWCGPCIYELPHLQRLYESRGDVSVVSMLIDDSDSSDGISEMGITYPVLGMRGRAPYSFGLKHKDYDREFQAGDVHDDMGEILAKYFYGATTIPLTFVIGKDKVVREVVIYGMNERQLELLVDKHLK